MSTDPLLGNGSRYVPLSLYLEDRREIKDDLTEIKADVKAMRREMDRDDGSEVAEQAAEVAIANRNIRWADRLWQAGMVVSAAGLAALATHFLT